MVDVVVIGAGPAGVFLATELAERGLTVVGVSLQPPAIAWPNTYGIWVDELSDLGLGEFLSHSWQDCVVRVSGKTLPLQRHYGRIDRRRIQAHWLDRSRQVRWQQGEVSRVQVGSDCTEVTTTDGEVILARLVVDASGYQSKLVQRSPHAPLAFQAAYGITGRFSRPPIAPQQMVLMDYGDDHLSPADRQHPPTFLYAMDLGDGVYFVEETSLAYSPAVPIATLEQRLYQRLQQQGIEVKEIHHVERCLFPMNLPLPDLSQPVVGFGGAASMVHPASGYMFGSVLRRGPDLATAIAASLGPSHTPPRQAAAAAWQALWPEARRRKYYLYRFGLENLMAFSPLQLNHFFEAFFKLETKAWSGFLSDSLTLPDLVRAMVDLFGQAPNDVRWGLLRSVTSHGHLLRQTLVR
ncbi:MAG: lycopene cyclase family protein [Cyanobacteria bacterium REEB459]|nr:lycopene cyclase family protein [Cyanobacteria bacterium REEB459]